MRHPVAASALAVALCSAGIVASPSACAARDYLQIEALAIAGEAEGTSEWVMYLDGEFEPGADRRLAAFVAEQGITRPYVYLNSPGGSLLAGIAVGRELRELEAETDVGRRSVDPRRPTAGVCYSSCPFAYAGGVSRRLSDGSTLGVHRARNRVAVPDDAAFEERVAADASRYLIEMGVRPGLVEFMQSVPAGEIRLLPVETARWYGLVDDPIE